MTGQETMISLSYRRLEGYSRRRYFVSDIGINCGLYFVEAQRAPAGMERSTTVHGFGGLHGLPSWTKLEPMLGRSANSPISALRLGTSTLGGDRPRSASPVQRVRES